MAGAACAALAAAAPAAAQSSADASASGLRDWQLGLVLDVAMTSRALALGGRDRGLALGHSDVVASGPLTSLFKAHLGAVFETHEGKLEKHLEEAWIETTRLPAGLQLRAGRFASQVGYLNQQHPHADDFVERPLLYRGFFGGHWNDDGLRLSWTAPTPFYLMAGAEAFRGKRLVESTVRPARNPGIATLGLKVGSDLGLSQSWQLGLSHIRSRRESAGETHDEAPGVAGAAHEHDHAHSHGAVLSGRKTWMIDAVWKWAPSGNNRNQQVRVGFEAARTTGLGVLARPKDKNEANTMSVVWRWRPDWEVGARADWLRGRMPHGDHMDTVLLRERAVMLAWKPTHMQALRLQYTTQRDAVGLSNPAKRSVQLQYVMAFGAHAAHAY